MLILKCKRTSRKEQRISRNCIKRQIPRNSDDYIWDGVQRAELLTITPGDSDTSGLWPPSLETMLLDFMISSQGIQN